MSTLNIQLLCRKSRKKSQNYCYLLPDLAPCLTLSGSNYPWLEQFSMVPKMFEPLKFDCIFLFLQEYKSAYSLESSQQYTLMSTQNIGICFLREIRHANTFFGWKRCLIWSCKTHHPFYFQILCVMPWKPPCYDKNCGITPSLVRYCDAVILNSESFDTYCPDDACRARATVPFTKLYIGKSKP